jgi:hypothetical protein
MDKGMSEAGIRGGTVKDGEEQGFEAKNARSKAERWSKEARLMKS